MTMTSEAATKGSVKRWRMGDEGDWCTIYVDLGILQAEVVLSSRTARAFALEVLMEQGPHLGYQPPNEHMRERPAPSFSTPVEKPSRQERQEIARLAGQLAQLLEHHGPSVFSSALAKAGER